MPLKSKLINSILLIFFVVSTTLFVACSSQFPAVRDLVIPESTIANSATSTNAVKPEISATQLPSEIPQPTTTKPPNPTATPTQTPTIAMPVSIGTPLPILTYQPITAENANDLREIVRYGVPIVQAAQLSADGKSYFEATSDGVTIYATYNWKVIKQLPIRIATFSSHSISVNADGSRFAIITLDGVRVLNIDGKALFGASISTNADSQIHISPDGKMVSVADCHGSLGSVPDCSTTIYQVDNGNKLKQVQTKSYHPGFTFSPKSTYFASWFGGIVDTADLIIYRTNDWSSVATTAIPSEAADLVFSPNEETFASISPKQILLQKTENGKAVRQIMNDLSTVWMDLYYSHYLRLNFSTSGDQIAYTSGYDGKNRQAIQIRGISDGTLIANKQILAWNLITASGQNDFSELIPSVNATEDITNLANVSYYNGKLYGYLSNVTFSRTGIIVSSYDFSLCNYEWEKEPECVGEPISATQHTPSQFYYVTKSGVIFTVRKSENSSAVDLIQGTTNKILATIPNVAGCYPGYISDSGKYVLCVDRYYSALYQTDTGKKIKDWNARINSASISDDERYLYVDWSGEDSYGSVTIISIQNLETGQEIYKQSVKGRAFLSLSSNPDRLIYSEENHNWSENTYVIVIHVYDINEKADTILSTITGLPETNSQSASLRVIEALTVSLDQSLIAIGFNDGLVLLVDKKNDNTIKKWYPHNDEISGLAFTSNNEMLATAGMDGFIRIWSVIKK